MKKASDKSIQISICNGKLKEQLQIGFCPICYFQPDNSKIPQINFLYSKQSGEASLAHSSDKPTNENQYDCIYTDLPLLHSDSCTVQLLQLNKNLSFQKTCKPIKLAACTFVLDIDNKILLNKRNSDLRIFPNCWVVPGGRVEQGEQIEQTALRELEEECGIDLLNQLKSDKPERVTRKQQQKQLNIQQFRPFAVYESVYPTTLEQGLPQYQNLIVFYLLKLEQKSEQIHLKLQPSEVESALWIEPEVLYALQTNQIKDNQAFLNQIYKGKSGRQQDKQDLIDIPLRALSGYYPNEIGEGIGEGHVKVFKYLYSQGFFNLKN